MTGFQQDRPPAQGCRGFPSPGHARDNGRFVMGSAAFVIISHPKWQEFAWVAPPDYAIAKAVMGGIPIVEVVG